MRKLAKDMVIAVLVLAMICLAFWQLGWISSWHDVILLYVLLAMAVTLSILKNEIIRMWKKCQKEDHPLGGSERNG